MQPLRHRTIPRQRFGQHGDGGGVGVIRHALGLDVEQLPDLVNVGNLFPRQRAGKGRQRCCLSGEVVDSRQRQVLDGDTLQQRVGVPHQISRRRGFGLGGIADVCWAAVGVDQPSYVRLHPKGEPNVVSRNRIERRRIVVEVDHGLSPGW